MTRITLLVENEQALIERLCKHDSLAQRQLFDMYHKKLFAICIRYLKDEEEALDALNRSFMKIFDKIHSFKGNAKLETWMKRITINTCLNKIKSNKSYKNTFIQTDEFIFYDEPDESQNENDDNWWEKALALPSEVFFNLIENLPPATRTVFNLYAVDGFTHPQISEQLSISTGTSKWHLNKARSILKEKIIQLIQNKNFNYEAQQSNE